MFLRCLCLAPLLLGLSSNPARADDDDPVMTELKKAKDEYDKQHAKAVAQLVQKMDKKIQSLPKSADIKAVAALKNEMEFVKSTGRMPLSSLFAQESNQFERSLGTPKKEMMQAYDKAIRKYTKSLLIPKAEALQNEQKEFVWAEDPRRYWVYDNAYFQQQPDGTWVETNTMATWKFKEVTRITEYVELYDASRQCGIRLQVGRCLVKWGTRPWGPLYQGEWKVPPSAKK